MNQTYYNSNYTTNDPIYRSFANNYTNFSTIYAYSLNSTGITWAQATNGTLMNQSWFNTNYSTSLFKIADYNSNYSTNDPIYRSFVANYSTFLTHITWANALNGSLLTQANFTTNYSTSLAKLTQLNIFGAFNQTFDTNLLFLDVVSNRVGIGTATPQNTLNVVGDFNVSNSTYPANFLVQNGKVGIMTATPQNKLNVVGDINATTNIYASNNISASAFRILNNTVTLPSCSATLRGFIMMNITGITYGCNGSTLWTKMF
jgi:hypothetical protein